LQVDWCVGRWLHHEEAAVGRHIVTIAVTFGIPSLLHKHAAGRLQRYNASHSGAEVDLAQPPFAIRAAQGTDKQGGRPRIERE
jgi:hypothetical protein